MVLGLSLSLLVVQTLQKLLEMSGTLLDLILEVLARQGKYVLEIPLLVELM